MALEAETESTAAMATPDALEARFASLEGGGVEDELRVLKQGRWCHNLFRWCHNTFSLFSTGGALCFT